MDKRKIGTLGSLVAVCAVLAACSSGGGSSSGAGQAAGGASAGGNSGGGSSAGKTPVSFMLANPTITLGHTQLAVAAEQGYFGDNGVAFNLLTSQGTAAVVQAVATGSADLGQADTLAIDTAATKGVSNITAVCSYVAANIYSIAVPANSSVKTVADLKGKRIGVQSLATGAYYNAEVLLNQAGLSPSSATFVTLGSSAALLHALQGGQVDAVATIDTDLGNYKNANFNVRVFQPSGPFQWQWNVVVANNAFLASHKAAVASTCKAIQEGEYFAVNYPAQAVQDYQKYGGDTTGLSDSQAEAEVMARAKPAFKSYPAGKDQWGWMNTGQMQSLANLYKSLKLYTDTPTVSSLYSDELIPQMQFSTSSIKP
jgi:NitT/TauT family transport system substrate-binding protein